MNSLVKFNDAVSNWILDPFNDPFSEEWGWKNVFPSLSIKDYSLQTYTEEDTGIVEAALPGFDKEDISVELKDNLLTIVAEKKIEKKNGFANKKMVKTVTIGEEYDQEKCKISYKNGVLKAVFPQREEKKPKKLTIKIEE